MSKHCLPTERPLVSAELVREVASGDAAGVPGSVYKVDGKSGHAWPEPGLPHNVIAGQSHSTPGAEAVDSYAELASHSEPATASFKTPGPATQPVR
jgi:hypothetical protein